MNRKPSMTLPLARKDGLLVRAVNEEMLVYDLERHKAHCLNRTAALVWGHCDGKATVADVARLVGKKIGTPPDEETIRNALSQLDRAGLLQGRLTRADNARRLSRRQAVRSLSVAAAAAVPIVTTIVAPHAAEAGTCTPAGETCTGLPCCGSATRCFVGRC
ncbi:MAG TPA: PqqD family protein [Blastocatellia bacterium]|nr:PqqD family protein [Blastocatellia bacterium]